MAPQQQQQGGDNAFAPIWIMAALIIVGYLLWYKAHTYIVSFVFFLNVAQAKIVHFFIGQALLQQDIYYMQTVNPSSVSWDTLVQYTENVGQYTRYPVFVILSIFAFILYRSNIKVKFRHLHDMKTLRLQEQINWPAIMPVVKLDLAKEDIRQGPWAMALSPLEFSRKNKLLKKEDVILDNPDPGMEMTAGIRRGDAKRIFTLQLGPYFDGFERCSPQAQVMAAVFMARINRDRDAAVHILEVLDKTATEGKPNYAIALPILRKYQNTELVQAVVQKHAYLLTVMASLTQAARADGVVASAEFLWLKPVDRRLWYMLNCVGRQTPFAEVAGPFAHWKAERAMGRSCLAPMIDEAIKALELAVKDVKLSARELQELQP